MVGRVVLPHSYQSIISTQNLLDAWREFVRGKRSRKDVQEFELNLMGNVLSLQRELAKKTYQHSSYEAFNISDPKPRNIHKAMVRDRLFHHALYRILYPFFDKTFIADSYSCRRGKGMHKAINRFRAFAYKATKNQTRTAWVLKCDIRKFFASIDQRVLIEIIRHYIRDEDIIWLLSQVLASFYSTREGIGLPLGNLTSQLFVNVYMNEFDQFVKHKLKAKYYIRYADDFVILSRDREWLFSILELVRSFLGERLHLTLHPDKVSVRTLASGVDFLGWVHFPDHRVLRTSTKRHMMRNLEGNESENRLNSYLGLLRHGTTEKIRAEILERFPIHEAP